MVEASGCPTGPTTTPDDHAGYGDEEFPEQVHGHFAAEIGWTIAPAILLLVIGIFSVALILDLDDVEASPNATRTRDMEIVVVGHQWWWEYQYHLDGDTDTPPDIVTANDVVIPVDQDIRHPHHLSGRHPLASGSPGSTARRTPFPAGSIPG